MFNKYEKWYMETLNDIIKLGQFRGDRTGTGVYSLPSIHYTHDLRESYPLLFSRFFNPVHPITEISWMMSGDSNITYLKKHGCPFWDSFAVKGDKILPVDLNRVQRLRLLAEKRGVPYGQVLALFANEQLDYIDIELDKLSIPNTQDMLMAKDGDLGPVYGVQWRHWPNPDGTTFDQLTYALEALRNDPNSRRVIVDCWNPSFLPDPKKSPADNAALGKMALTPCHFCFGFYTWELSSDERYKLLPNLHEGELDEKVFMAPGDIIDNYDKLYAEYNIPTHYLDISFTMRSNDWVLGQPANMNMYSAMLMMFAKELNMIPRFVNYTGWDSHVYSNHLEGIVELNKRWDTKEHKYSTAQVKLKTTKPKGLFDYDRHDFEIIGYKPGTSIKFPIAI